MRRAQLAGLVLFSVLPSRVAHSQASTAVASWIHLDAVPGTETSTAKALLAALPGWRTDRWGNLVRTVGSGTPHRVVACALDYSAFVVSHITDDGYLRLRRTGVPTHPLWNQFQEAQHIAIVTGQGRVPGVVAVPNGHFARQHVADSAVVTDAQLWVDIGASSRAEVAARGVALLDPVLPDRPLWTFGSYATGPAAGARAGCAAVASAAAHTPVRGTTTFVLSTQRAVGWVGLATVLTSLGSVDKVAIIDVGRAARLASMAPSARLPQAFRALYGRVRDNALAVYAPAVRWPGATVESIDSSEANALRQWVADAAEVPAAPAWVTLPTDTARRLAPRRDAYGAIEKLFMDLADLHGVAGHETLVRDAVLARLPKWARDRAQVDSAGNITVSAGPDRDPVAMIAHMDEVGFEVDRILPDGRVTLRSVGGAVLPSWEGVPALLHFDDAGRAPLRGVFIPRDSARLRNPGALQAWFGLDSAALVAAGVRPRLSLTAYKRAGRLAGTRITGRASDDRTGTSALLSAIAAIKPDALPRRVYFVWTVREEGGLNGARAWAATYGRGLSRVYAVDTFVSSDSPLESRQFAFAPLGRGAVLRGADDGTVALRAERDHVLRVARANAIPLQVGTTQGSTDGSAVSPYGAPNLGIGWPGRYSHGPAEVFDLRDAAALSRLIVALAVTR
ncbi:MAG: M20/M25/M40 family metallo-hydrolase [Gemmatimonadetes bacterium]|nr:M20/M25/M40 family metallo-hydrolase [Gemmatimonadota bacterium]